MVVVDSLLGSAQVELALECLASLRRCAPEARLRLRDDGTLTSLDRDRLLDGLGTPDIVARREADEQVEPLLARHPASLAYRRAHPLGLKLFDVALGQPGRLSFCDSDVLFLRPVHGLFGVAEPHQAIFLQDVQNAYSLRSWQILRHGLQLPARINTGLISYPREEFDLDLVDWYLARPEMNFAPMWREQTAWALLAGRLATRAFEPLAFRIAAGPPSLEDDADPPAALHFVTPSRSYLQKWRGAQGSPIGPTTQPAWRLTARGLLLEEIGRRLRRG